MENRTLRWSTPRTLNDPYDLQFDLHIEVDREAVISAALPKLWNAFYGDLPPPSSNNLGAAIQIARAAFPRLTREKFDKEYSEAIDEGLLALERGLPEAHKEIRKIMADSKILCLSETPDNNPMWAHYAENHQGLVLEFRSVEGLGSPYDLARPVEYLEDMPRLIDNDGLAEIAAGLIAFSPQSVLDKLLYTKSVEWAHERERRISASAGRYALAPYEDIPFNARELSAMIVGCRMSEDDRAAFVNLATRLYPHASILQTKLAKKSFRLEVAPL